MMEFTGKQLIAGKFAASGIEKFNSIRASDGASLGYSFYESTNEEVDQAARSASMAFAEYKNADHKSRATFLKNIAAEIEALGDLLLETASNETGLGIERLKGERARTMNQLNAFANYILDGTWVKPIIDKADPDRKPLPKPDLRQMQIPLGPVGVFGASNFPFAFSVAGGDTAAALAAGCPVVFKAHPAHPATCELVARAILQAITKSALPTGVFSMVHGRSNQVGGSLVAHPLIKAIAFTGSFKGGKALYDIAVRRNEPIPVYAEMGSVNPVLILSSAGNSNSDALAKQLAGSITLGAGQFCTNPGLLLMKDGPETHAFLNKVASELAGIQPATMLTSTIQKAYQEGIKHQRKVKGVQTLADEPSQYPTPHLAKIKAEDAMNDRSVLEEVFGPSSVAVISNDMNELARFCETLSGQLTATILGEPEEIVAAAPVVNALREKVGRIIINGFPTGVEVSPAMVHGGPYPATTDSRSTSVGITAIYRFTRPVCFQNFPEALLPDELKG